MKITHKADGLGTVKTLPSSDLLFTHSIDLTSLIRIEVEVDRRALIQSRDYQHFVGLAGQCSTGWLAASPLELHCIYMRGRRPSSSSSSSPRSSSEGKSGRHVRLSHPQRSYLVALGGM
ncbi:hypothetical protein PybrP1_007127 [[Pythium] brassicae (nom. inval.)]|nr:hypothetical protein PybrP1_007127 [[Pythium] brassicae (nom. inval.)]